MWRAAAGDLSPVFGGHLRAQFGTQQAFAGFLQVNSSSGAAGGRVVCFGDSAFIDDAGAREQGSWSARGVLPARGPSLLSEDFWDARLVTAFSSFSAAPPQSLHRDAFLRRAEFQRCGGMLCCTCARALTDSLSNTVHCVTDTRSFTTGKVF